MRHSFPTAHPSFTSARSKTKLALPPQLRPRSSGLPVSLVSCHPSARLWLLHLLCPLGSLLSPFLQPSCYLRGHDRPQLPVFSPSGPSPHTASILTKTRLKPYLRGKKTFNICCISYQNNLKSVCPLVSNYPQTDPIQCVPLLLSLPLLRLRTVSLASPYWVLLRVGPHLPFPPFPPLVSKGPTHPCRPI